MLADGPAGVRIEPIRKEDPSRTYYCTAFPIASLVASTWDVNAAGRIGRAMGNEALEYGVDVILGPALNTHRNPLGGRNFEYFSEDPLVSGRLAGAIVAGIQSQGVGTSPKHFAANDHEWNRNTIDVKVSQRALREIYLRGFEIVVQDARPWTIMSSYNKVNGTYTSESPDLLMGVLRGDWKFDGLVMTDWFGGSDAVAQMKAGNDLLMPGTGQQRTAILAALESGALPEPVLDRNVAAILDVITRTPAFKRYAPSNAPELKAHARVAREAGAGGMVLLRNEGALPLTSAAKLALAGNTSYSMITGGTGSGDVNEAYSISLAEGLKAAGLEVDGALANRYADYLAEQEKTRPQAGPFMPRALPPEMALPAEEIARLSSDADAALVTIGRLSGEFTDRKKEGDFEFSAAETRAHPRRGGGLPREGKKVVVVLNIGGVVETVSWRDLPRRHPARLAAGPGGGPRDCGRAHGTDSAIGKARDDVPGDMGRRALVGQLPGQGAARARSGGATRTSERRSRRRTDVRRRHLGRVPPFRDEGREDGVSVRFRIELYHVRLHQPAAERQGVRQGPVGVGDDHEHRPGERARGRPAVPHGARKGRAETRRSS